MLLVRLLFSEWAKIGSLPSELCFFFFYENLAIILDIFSFGLDIPFSGCFYNVRLRMLIMMYLGMTLSLFCLGLLELPVLLA